MLAQRRKGKRKRAKTSDTSLSTEVGVPQAVGQVPRLARWGRRNVRSEVLTQLGRYLREIHPASRLNRPCKPEPAAREHLLAPTSQLLSSPPVPGLGRRARIPDQTCCCYDSIPPQTHSLARAGARAGARARAQAAGADAETDARSMGEYHDHHYRRRSEASEEAASSEV